MNLRDEMAEVVHRTKSPLHDHGQAVADALIAKFGLTVERRAVSRTLPQFGGQPTYYNPDAADNGGAMGDYVSRLPVESRVVSDWRPEGPETPAPTPRLRECVEAWPDCETGEYDPRCCRFPKSCSCTVYDPTRVSADDLEEL